MCLCCDKEPCNFCESIHLPDAGGRVGCVLKPQDIKQMEVKIRDKEGGGPLQGLLRGKAAWHLLVQWKLSPCY